MNTPNTCSRILAIDTATPYQALALIDGEKLLANQVQRVRYNHGSSLLKNIDDLLQTLKFELHSVDLFAVGLGPGSFTGLRVGLATAKALARATNTPIVGVSSLAAAALTPAKTNPQATILAAFDARRREVYAGAYRYNGDGLQALFKERAIGSSALIKLVDEELEGPIILVGDGLPAYKPLQAWERPNLIKLPLTAAAPDAAAVAYLARQQALTQGPADLISLEPNYIRATDARQPNRPLRSIPEL